MTRHPRSKLPSRSYNQRTGADVRLLIILALVSLLLALGLSAWRKVQEDTVPAAQEHNRRLEQAVEPPRHEPQQLRVGAEE